MNGNGITIERVATRDGYEEFARLPYHVYAAREAWWPPDVQNEIDHALAPQPALVASRGRRLSARGARAGWSRASARLSIAAISNIGTSNSGS